MTDETPPKYVPQPRQWDDKQWLYEQYWGEELLSIETIATRLDVAPSVVRRALHDHGIPRRIQGYTPSNTVSPFRGFYDGDMAVRDNDPQNNYDEDYDPPSETLHWERLAEQDPIVQSVGD
jgi:hypothetical protein